MNLLWEMLDISTLFFSEFDSNLICYNSMKLWYASQNDRSHGIVIHQVGIKFWKKNIWMSNIPHLLYSESNGDHFWTQICDVVVISMRLAVNHLKNFTCSIKKKKKKKKHHILFPIDCDVHNLLRGAMPIIDIRHDLFFSCFL
jgi:hypothetical protein